MDGTKLLKNTAQAASYNILLQIFFRAQTFILNGFILRYISKEVLGIVNVRLFLLYSSVLFLSKEAFRNAVLSNIRGHDWSKVINLLWLTVPASVICSFCLGYVWIYFLELPSEEELRIQYVHAVIIICACCIFEMTGEPLYIIARINGFNKLKVILESVCLSLNCFTLAFTVWFIPKQAIHGYAIGQIAYSFVWVIGIYLYFINYLRKKKLKSDAKGEFPFNSIYDFFPSYFSKNDLFLPDQVALTWTFFKQGILKNLLTEGEKYIMTLLGVLTFAEQGIYDVVNNLGSLAARFLLRPIEDSSYQFFAGLVKRDEKFSKQNQDEILLIANVLKNLLRFMMLLGLLAISFGIAYSRLLLHLYGGTILSSGSGPILLRCHCVYILFLAVNGITECFAFATMSKHDVERYNLVMIGFSIVFVLLSWFTTLKLGSVGFIIANCANMLSRIICSINIIRKAFQESTCTCKPLSGLIPDVMVLGTLFICLIVTIISEIMYGELMLFSNLMHHVFIGAICLAIVGLVILLREKELVQFVRGLLLHQKVE